LNIPGWKVRGITRNPNSAAAQALTLRGVEVVKANLDDVSTLTEAFRGANVIFLVTDYWAAVNVPENYAKAAAQGKPIRDYAFDLEVAQGINAAKVAVDPSVLPTLERFVFSSLADMRKWTNGKMSFKNHFESKGRIEEHILGLPELAEKLSTVQLGYYYTNWKQSPDFAPRKLDDGSFLYRTPFGADTRMPWIDASSDTGKFVEALVNAPAGTHMLGVSEFGTYADLMQVFGDVFKVKTSVENVDAHEFFATASLPDDLRPVLVQLVSFMDEYGWTGGDPRIKLPQEVDSEIRTTTIRRYVEGEDWSSLL
jgi:hypothetical protein